MKSNKKRLKAINKIEIEKIKIQIEAIKEENIFDLLYDESKIMGDFGSVAYSLCRLQDELDDFRKRKLKELEERLVYVRGKTN